MNESLPNPKTISRQSPSIYSIHWEFKSSPSNKSIQSFQDILSIPSIQNFIPPFWKTISHIFQCVSWWLDTLHHMIFPRPAHHANKVSFLKKSNSSNEHIDTNLPSNIHKEQAFPKHNPGISFSSSNTIYLISHIHHLLTQHPLTNPPIKELKVKVKKKVIINKTRNTSPNHIYIFTSVHHSKRKNKKTSNPIHIPKQPTNPIPFLYPEVFPFFRGVV